MLSDFDFQPVGRFWIGYQPPLLYLPLRLTCEHQRNKQAHPADIRGLSQWLRLAINYKIWLVIFQPSGIWLWVVHLLVWWWILKLAFFSKICIPARRNIFNWNSCLVLLLMRFPASWKLLIALPAFRFCFDYVRSTSTYLLLSDLFYRPKLRSILSKLASRQIQKIIVVTADRLKKWWSCVQCFHYGHGLGGNWLVSHFSKEGLDACYADIWFQFANIMCHMKSFSFICVICYVSGSIFL